ncbi:ArsR/SmtB family transcription factor [Allobranchiibius huperziae]|uniref:DNA-binding transcriptional ArsR family regulator n=1 Tax=Allobranchiibius huperziae TaxID=1874116 RepID=A0A853DFN7_9MICO|nr:metalloregulator ArsR/SmtB family transcription factor [Allobranchiibius huperziae]NYJ74843.1 DNA-binding transcriptional ArsR family regulator [Allobranchiibius huperziae]
MDAMLAAIGDPGRRVILDSLRDQDLTAGEIADLLPVARPGVSRHLRVLREAGLVDVHAEGQRRIYSLRPQGLTELDGWLTPYRDLWSRRLDALHTEVARGRSHREDRT